MRVSVLGSGSSGNCTLVSSERTCLLIDLGFGPRSLKRRLKQAELQGLQVDAILLTHGHYDHCRGISSFVKQQAAPVYMNQGTRCAVPELSCLEQWECFRSGEPFTIGDFTIEAFPVSHDCSQPVGFRISGDGFQGALATDLGELNQQVIGKLSYCDWLVLESNHDEAMLRLGPYPWSLKRRVMGPLGHLSNAAIAEFLRNGFDGRARHIFLAHLSHRNNHPELALASAHKALRARQLALLESCRVHLTHQNKPSIVLNL